MTTAKIIAVPAAVAAPAVPAASVTTQATSKTVSIKKATPKPVTQKQSAKKVAPRKAAGKKLAATKPLSKAFAPGNTGHAAKVTNTSKIVKAVKTTKPDKVEKPKKPKLVRDSFTIPKAEYMVLEALKLRATKLTRSVKKSELLRAGIKALASLSDAAFLSTLEKVPTIKTGRPTAAK